MGLEQVNQQQLAVASNLTAAQNIDFVLRSEFERKTDTDNATKIEESAIKKALEGKTGKLGIEIIANLASKLAQTLPTNQILSNLKEEYGFLLDSKEEAAEDAVMIKTPGEQIAKVQKQKQNLHSDSGFSEGKGESVPQDKGEAVKEYIGAYSQMLLNGGSEVKKKVDQLEKHLLQEKEVSLKDLQGVKVQVANTIRAEILQQLKQAYLKQVLAKSKSLEWLISKKETQNFIDFAFMNEKIGGYDFGGYEEHLQGAVNRVREETHRELKDFVDKELTEKVMQKAMGKESKELEKEIEGLLKLGQKVGFDVQEFVAKIPKMKDDLGLNPVIDFEYVAADANMDNNSREGHRYQYTLEEEKEVLTDKLRALYLRRAVYGDVRTILETQFKMIKLKNGLIRLGVKNFDEIEAQGKALAKVKLFEMLREAFEERATYAKLAGEAWKMTERKIKTVLKNLENLGVTLSQRELDLVRDKANEKMYREAEHELGLIETAIQAKGEIAYLTNKRKMVLEIMERLAQESGLPKPKSMIEYSIKDAC